MTRFIFQNLVFLGKIFHLRTTVIFSRRNLSARPMLEQAPMPVVLPASRWTSSSHATLRSLSSARPSSLSSFTVFLPRPLTGSLAGTGLPLSNTPVPRCHGLATQAVCPPTSHTWGSHASGGHSQRSLHPAVTSSLGNKISLFPLRPNQDGASSVRPSQDYSAPASSEGTSPLLWVPLL